VSVKGVEWGTGENIDGSCAERVQKWGTKRCGCNNQTHAKKQPTKIKVKMINYNLIASKKDKIANNIEEATRILEVRIILHYTVKVTSI